MVDLSFLEEEDFEVGDFNISPGRMQVEKGGKKAEGFTSHEFALLNLLVSNPGRIYSVDNLLDFVYGEDSLLRGENSIKQHVHHMRRKLKKISGESYIENVRGVGYRFRDQP